MRSGHRKTSLQRWSKKDGDGTPALGEILERKPFEDASGSTTFFFAEDQINRLLCAEAAAAPGNDAEWLTIDEALHYASIATIYMLVENDEVETRPGGRNRTGGKISKPCRLFSAKDLVDHH
jgi:hypothetical protein